MNTTKTESNAKRFRQNNLNFKTNAKKNPNKNIEKHLSPAKKFRLRLKRAKFQRRQQAREEYFEHDTRENQQKIFRSRKRTGRHKKFNRDPQKYRSNLEKSNGNVNAEKKLQHQTTNGRIEKISVVNSSRKSHIVTASSPSNAVVVTADTMTQDIARNSFHRKEQAKSNEEISSSISSQYQTNTSANVNNLPAIKCCCHCACSGSKRKPRRKLSSPYLGDFSHIVHINGVKCSSSSSNLTGILNKTIMTTQHENFVKSASESFLKFKQKPAIEKSSNSASYKNCMRSVVRFVSDEEL